MFRCSGYKPQTNGFYLVIRLDALHSGKSPAVVQVQHLDQCTGGSSGGAAVSLLQLRPSPPLVHHELPVGGAGALIDTAWLHLQLEG